MGDRKAGLGWSVGEPAAGGAAALSRGHTAIEGLYRDLWPELCRYVAAKFGAGPPEPEDVAQLAFTRFAALDDPASVKNPRAFLMRSARNIVVDHHRHLAVVRRHVEAVEADPDDHVLDDLSPERVFLARDEMRVVAGALDRLPPAHRDMVLLNRVENVSCAALGRRYGVSATEVKRRIANALADCDEALERAAARRSRPGS